METYDLYMLLQTNGFVASASTNTKPYTVYAHCLNIKSTEGEGEGKLKPNPLLYVVIYEPPILMAWRLGAHIVRWLYGALCTSEV